MEDLFGNVFDEITIEENMAIDMLQEQARLVESKSRGLIHGSFRKVEYIKGVVSTLQGVAGALDIIRNGDDTEVIDEDIKDKKDINSLYSYETYKFEVYNDTYRFRVFTLQNRIIFPIEIMIDEGICEELNYDRKMPIGSNAQLKEIISTVFQSSKMRIILSKMMKYKENNYSKKILELLTINGTMSSSEISTELLISKVYARKLLSQLEENGKIECERLAKRTVRYKIKSDSNFE